MIETLSDAELVMRLKALIEHKTPSAAARVLGMNRSAFAASIQTAKEKGLTAESVIRDPVAILKTKVKMLTAELASVHRTEDTAESIRKTIYDLAEMTPDPPTWINAPRPVNLPGVPVALWSDWHYGETVSANELGGVNEFNHEIADQRIKRLVDTTINLSIDHMVNPKYPGIVICLGGDMISGTIHEELRETNEGPVQKSLLRLQEQLIAALTTMADRFGKVFIPCVVGNHGRMKLKPHAKHKVYENYEWNLYCQLEAYFKKDKRFQFFIPGEADAYFTVLGHRFLLTHGDSLGVRGGDGIIGALGPICRGAIKVGRNQAQIGRDFDTLLMGHWHTYIPRGEAAPVIVNGTLKGFDEYAHLFLRVPYSRPSQALWFVHQEHGITAQWQVFLDKRRNAVESSEWVSWLDGGK